MNQCIICKSKKTSELTTVPYEVNKYLDAERTIDSSWTRYIITNYLFKIIIKRIFIDGGRLGEIKFDHKLEMLDSEQLDNLIWGYNKKNANGDLRIIRMIDMLKNEKNFIKKIKVSFADHQNRRDFVIWRSGIIASSESCNAIKDFLKNVLM